MGRIIHIPNEVWINRHAVLAVDPALRGSGGVGFAASESSLSAARRDALEWCGTGKCRPAIEITNGCMAIAHGKNPDFSGYGAAATDEAASQMAVRHCRATGSNGCTVGWRHCALPERVR